MHDLYAAMAPNDLTAGGADAERTCPEGPGEARAPAGRYLKRGLP
jgi:hypothetical protein